MSARHDVIRGTEWIEYRKAKKNIGLYKTMAYEVFDITVKGCGWRGVKG